MIFSPCRGGDNCSKEGTHCSGCGRSHEEIAETKAIVASIVQFGHKMGYENVDHYTMFLAQKAARRIKEQRAEALAQR